MCSFIFLDNFCCSELILSLKLFFTYMAFVTRLIGDNAIVDS